MEPGRYISGPVCYIRTKDLQTTKLYNHISGVLYKIHSSRGNSLEKENNFPTEVVEISIELDNV